MQQQSHIRSQSTPKLRAAPSYIFEINTLPVHGLLLPTHTGFGGTPKADGLTSVTRLEQTYVTMLEQFDLTNVTVIGNSFGGWPPGSPCRRARRSAAW